MFADTLKGPLPFGCHYLLEVVATGTSTSTRSAHFTNEIHSFVQSHSSCTQTPSNLVTIIPGVSSNEQSIDSFVTHESREI